jgi:hypothetical protein
MRFTILHGKSQQEAVQIVDEAFEDLFRGLPIRALKITNQHRSWNGSMMTFGLTAKIGFLQNPIQGTAMVTEREITIDADLGMLEKLISQAKLKTVIEKSLQKLLPN